jgi:hypothetical protein
LVSKCEKSVKSEQNIFEEHFNHDIKKPLEKLQKFNLKTLSTNLKVPKREIFLTELFILSDPIWIGDLRNEPKKPFV